MLSTFLFVALLFYGNPYVMSLVVDRVSAGSVAPGEVFSTYGPYIIALIAINVFGHATSALDSESEALVQDALKTPMQGHTCIVVAHRLSTVANLDRIVVLDHGEIVEDGPHNQRVAQNGEYAHLWNRQTGAYLE
jgi:hypothetical protein